MISMRDVHKRFGAVTALAGVSLAIERGERVALVGSNGSGKTSLLRALVGLLRVSGQIEIDGVDVRRHPERALAALAYMPQVAPPLEAPVAELVRAYTALRGSAPRDVESKAAALGLDLAAVAGSRVRDLSGGMKQKLLAALVLSSAAPVLVCDEPTASLDAGARAAFFELVKERAQDSVLILCSHRLDEVENLVGRVVELRDGQVYKDEASAAALASLCAARIELTFAPNALCAQDRVLLAQWGFQRSGESSYGGAFTRTRKLELLEQVVEHFAQRLTDIHVLNREHVCEPEQLQVRRAG